MGKMKTLIEGLKDDARMGKMKNLIEKYTTNFKKELRGKLEALPPKARLGIVLTAFAAFASLCLYMTVTAIPSPVSARGTGQWRYGTSRNWTCRCRKV